MSLREIQRLSGMMISEGTNPKIESTLKKAYRDMRAKMDAFGPVMKASFEERFPDAQNVQAGIVHDDEACWIFRGYVTYGARYVSINDAELKSWLKSLGINVPRSALRTDSKGWNESVSFIAAEGI